ncbi:tyrosine aminotransferase-like [Sycon ciliatum]|uniref:tyrosine aminotransferase-like n=1 Tax=Sycon ciliatum TaxID=27933 RepID=UPI0031F7043E
MMAEEQGWNIRSSFESRHCINPIPKLVDGGKFKPNPDKQLIKLNIGDPTFYKNLPPSPVVIQAVTDVLQAGKDNDYKKTPGMAEARVAVAKKFSYPVNPVHEDHVIITSGCAQALEFALTTLCDPGTNILILKPGFSMYKVNTDSRQVEDRYYNLLPEKSWQADIEHMESLIDDKTRCIILVNPSNPCGSVYSKEHLLEIVAVAEKHRLPIITDEIYGGVVFGGAEFHALASLTDRVPILTCSGIGKSQLVPGWRTGWLILHDNHGRLEDVRVCLNNLWARILGSCGPIQAALPRILSEVPDEFFQNTNRHLEATSTLAYEKLASVPCILPTKPQGSIYMLFGINVDQLDGIADDVQFAEQLMSEESVFILPGCIFKYPNYLRIVLLAPETLISEAMDRIAAFCQRRMKAKRAE